MDEGNVVEMDAPVDRANFRTSDPSLQQVSTPLSGRTSAIRTGIEATGSHPHVSHDDGG